MTQSRRWPRKNDPGSIRARQEVLGLDGEVVGFDLDPWVNAAEQLTGAAVIPVSVAGPLELSLGEYALDDAGSLIETGRVDDEVFVPLAHTEGGLTASMQRGLRAVAESDGFRTHVLADRITRASCFVCRDAAEAIRLARWIEGEVDAMRSWLTESPLPELSRFAVLREAKTHVVGPMCHVLWRWTTGDAVGPNMMTRNSYALNMAYVMERAPVKPERATARGEHGRRQEAVLRVLPVRAREDGDRRDDVDRRGGAPGSSDDRGRPPRALLGGHARCGGERDAVGRVHTGVGDRGRVRVHRPGPGHGRDLVDGARDGPARRGRAARARSASPVSRWGRWAAGRRFPTRERGSG